MPIGKDDLSAKAKNGWAFAVGKPEATFAEIEKDVAKELERQGLLHNIRRLELIEERSSKVTAIREALRDADDEQIDATLAALKK